jgi:hypothetical protein
LMKCDLTDGGTTIQSRQYGLHPVWMTRS